jgi:2,3-bisphosphoglycerate-dependent phosphoglycerate mutase
MRHGWSQWNEENRFTGWVDVPLHSTGEREADESGLILKQEGYAFDVVFTSVLKRAIDTTFRCIHTLDQENVPVSFHWELDERHYGALQGKNKAEVAAQYGMEQMMLWRRSYAIRPPALSDEERLTQHRAGAFADVPLQYLPGTESLADCVARVVPWYEREVIPLLRAGKHVMISAHGNSLRALVKYLDAMSDEAITKLTLPTAIPLVYELDENFKPLKHYYLGDSEVVAKRIAQAEYTMYHVDGKRGP